MKKPLLELASEIGLSTLNSYSVVFFSRNVVFASVLMLVSFFDPVAGLCGLLAILTANTAALLIGLNRLNITSGIYGFNALLVGLGLGVYFQFSPELFILLVFSSLLTLFLTLFFEGMIGKYGLPFLTFPFLLTFWLVMLAARRYTGLYLSERGIFTYNEFYELGGSTLVSAYNWFNDLEFPIALSTFFKSLSAIFFQYHLLPGILIGIGLLYYSRIAFMLSLLGFYSAYIFYHFIGADLTELNYSFIGFNFVLTAIAVGGFFIISSRHSFLWVILLTPIISILLSSSAEFLAYFQLSTYSFPFNLVVILFLYMLRFREGKEKKLELVAFQEYSPEQNLYSQQNSRDRFKGNLYLPFGLPFMGEWVVTQAHQGEHTHQDQWKHAWDFEIADEDEKIHSGKGASLSDYHCFNKPVLAAADGLIEEVVDNIGDNPPGEVNLGQNWGNTIIIRHLDGLYSKVSHLRKGSVKVAKGTYVKKGDVIASCGNSGRSPYPHIHFQLQSTPYIGSPTLDYPLGRYILNSEGTYRLASWEKPRKGDLISNIDRVPSLGKAFNFIPGQQLGFLVTENEKEPYEVIWQVEIDIYNYTYLHCRKTGSKAYFRNEPDLLYFTWFSGDRSSFLYDFYQVAYKIAKGYYPGLVINDRFPLNTMKQGIGKVLQDFVAPFHIFLHREYQLRYTGMQDELSQSGIAMEIELTEKATGRIRKVANASLLVDHDRIARIEIRRNVRALIAVCHDLQVNT